MLTRGARAVRWFYRPEGDRWFARVRWMRLAGVFLGGMIAAYFGAVTAGFIFVRTHRSAQNVSWTDIALWRMRRERHRVANGDRLILNAQQMAGARKFGEALKLARQGMTDSPANRSGRILLAELEGMLGRSAHARSVLVEGLPYHYADASYVKRVLARLLQDQKDAFVLMLAERYRERLRVASESARLFALGAASAGYFRGNFDQAEDCLRRIPKLPESRDGRLLLAKIEWERGYRDLALVQLRQLAEERSGDGEIHRELVTHLRQHRLLDEARRRSLAFQIAHPTLAWPRIELMRAYGETGDNQRMTREVNAFLADFAGDESAALMLADLASNLGDVALAQRIAEHAAARAWRSEPFLFLTIETQVAAGNYRAALERIRACRKENAEWERRHEALFESLRTVAAFGDGQADEARSALGGFLAQGNLRAENLVAVANRLVALNAEEPAAQVLTKAVALDAQNQAALTRLVELDIVLNRGEELAEHVQRLLKMRRPSPDLLRVAQLKLGSDLFLFSRAVPAALQALAEVLERKPATHATNRP